MGEKKVSHRGYSFFITFHVEYIYDKIREDFLENFHQVEEYCVSVERHHSSLYKYHIHAYIKLKELASCSEVRDIVCSITEFGCNVQPCRSRKSVLRYITKEDESPFFNCSESELSFAYRARSWARRSPAFRFQDPFVLEHTNRWRFLRELHSEVSGEHSRRVGTEFNVEKWRGGWCMSTLLWARDFVKGRTRKALYLWGEGGVGKSTIIEKLCRAMGWKLVFYPVPGHFFCGNYEDERYDVVLFEEWEFNSFQQNMYQIRRFIEGRRFSVDVKHEKCRVVQCSRPCIFVSNESTMNMCIPMLRRLQVVEAYCRAVDNEYAWVPKEEVDAGAEEELQEVIELSSSPLQEEIYEESEEEGEKENKAYKAN